MDLFWENSKYKIHRRIIDWRESGELRNITELVIHALKSRFVDWMNGRLAWLNGSALQLFEKLANWPPMIEQNTTEVYRTWRNDLVETNPHSLPILLGP